MMPVFAFIGVPRARWLPPFPIPVFLLWPLVPLCLTLASLMKRARPAEAETLRATMHVFCELRGLCIDVDSADHRSVRVWFV